MPSRHRMAGPRALQGHHPPQRPRNHHGSSAHAPRIRRQALPFHDGEAQGRGLYVDGALDTRPLDKERRIRLHRRALERAVRKY